MSQLCEGAKMLEVNLNGLLIIGLATTLGAIFHQTLIGLAVGLTIVLAVALAARS
jgi:hypothetical protein